MALITWATVQISCHCQASPPRAAHRADTPRRFTYQSCGRDRSNVQRPMAACPGRRYHPTGPSHLSQPNSNPAVILQPRKHIKGSPNRPMVAIPSSPFNGLACLASPLHARHDLQRTVVVLPSGVALQQACDCSAH